MSGAVCRRVVVRGRVQGVGFRYWVLRRANSVGIAGWVRNLPDGRSLEALAQAEPTVLDHFLRETVREGPPNAFVSEYEEFEEPVVEGRTDFDVTA